jgi:hypothetical protein
VALGGCQSEFGMTYHINLQYKACFLYRYTNKFSFNLELVVVVCRTWTIEESVLSLSLGKCEAGN